MKNGREFFELLIDRIIKEEENKKKKLKKMLMAIK